MLSFGIAQNYTGNTIVVILSNGLTISATPHGDINSSKVLVYQEEGYPGQYFCRCETELVEILRDTEGSQIRPRQQVEEEIQILPFQVVTLSFLLGGDRSEEILGADQIAQVGVTNTGGLEYLVTGYNSETCNLIGYSSSGKSISSFPICPAPEDPIWFGYGFFGLHYKFTPEENPEIVETGNPLPPDLPAPSLYRVLELGLSIPPLGFYNFPHYPVFFERAEAIRIGGKTTSQSDELFSSTIVEDWEYLHDIGGNVDSPDVDILDFPENCTAANAGFIFTGFFERRTKAEYSRSTNIELNTATELWLNNQVYKGDRLERTIEDYQFTQTEALFNSGTNFTCVVPNQAGGLGFFDPTSSTASFTGEEINETRDYNFQIIENSWLYPVSLSVNRERKDLQQVTFNSKMDYIVPSENWAVQARFPNGFDFLVESTETQEINRQETKDIIKPELLFLGATGKESIFAEEIVNFELIYTINRERRIDKILRDYSTLFPQIINSNSTEEFTESVSVNLYFCDGLSSYSVGLNNSFSFKLTTEIDLAVGQFTIANDDMLPIASARLEHINHYLKTVTQLEGQAPVTDFTEIEKTDNNLFAQLENREVYIIAHGKRAIATISSYDFTDTEDPELSIATIRTINSITVNINFVEDYPLGLVTENEIIIYPSSNVSGLVYNELLQAGNKEYCNLVGSTLYYSKSVKFNLTKPTQLTEVYDILDGVIIQNSPEEGAFIPMSITEEEAKSIAYYPV